MTHWNLANTCVICPASQGVIEFENGRLRFECKELEKLEDIESRRSFWCHRSGWKPSHAKKLKDRMLSAFATTEIKTYFVNARMIHDNEVITMGRNWYSAGLTNPVPKLYTEPERLESCSFEKSAIPTLLV